MLLHSVRSIAFADPDAVPPEKQPRHRTSAHQPLGHEPNVLLVRSLSDRTNKARSTLRSSCDETRDGQSADVLAGPFDDGADPFDQLALIRHNNCRSSNLRRFDLLPDQSSNRAKYAARKHTENKRCGCAAHLPACSPRPHAARNSMNIPKRRTRRGRELVPLQIGVRACRCFSHHCSSACSPLVLGEYACTPADRRISRPARDTCGWT